VFESITATRFDRRMTNGRTGPFLLECENEVGELVEVVAKFSGPQVGVDGLVREALCAMLAADLGLPVPPCYCVHLEPPFLAALKGTHPAEAAALVAAVPTGFGSAKLPPGYAIWMRDRSIPKAMQQGAAEIYAFDLLIQNPDRRPDNPNLQSRGERFAIFDHELALVTQGVLFWKPPWVLGALVGAGAIGKHILRSGLKGFQPDYARLIGAWEAIDDHRHAAYRAALPQEWSTNPDAADTATAFLKELRENLRPAMQEILRTLS
jgi:hypothetical protein